MYQIVDLTTHTFLYDFWLVYFGFSITCFAWIDISLDLIWRLSLKSYKSFICSNCHLKRGNRPHLVMTLFTSQLSSYTSWWFDLKSIMIVHRGKSTKMYPCPKAYRAENCVQRYLTGEGKTFIYLNGKYTINHKVTRIFHLCIITPITILKLPGSPLETCFHNSPDRWVNKTVAER